MGIIFTKGGGDGMLREFEAVSEFPIPPSPLTRGLPLSASGSFLPERRKKS
jgi:hypothetical protein